jgi:hypothetical protein
MTENNGDKEGLIYDIEKDEDAVLYLKSYEIYKGVNVEKTPPYYFEEIENFCLFVDKIMSPIEEIFEDIFKITIKSI